MKPNHTKYRIIVGLTHLFVWGLLVSFCVTGEVFSQGFNWQYSARFPTDSPTLFVGLQGGYSPYSSQTFGITYRDEQANCDCARFSAGLGTEWKAGLHIEKWLEQGTIALFGTIGFQAQASSFRALMDDTTKGRISPDFLPNRSSLITEYTFSANLFQTSLEGGAKVKFYPLPLFIAASVRGAFLVQSSNQLQERVATVSERDFQNFPVQNLPANFFTLNPISFAGTARIGADVPLAKGLYASPAVFASWQGRVISPTLWSSLTFGLDFTLLFGL